MIRTRICLYLLLLTPLVVYWQTIFHDYGMRDDYSELREAREEPGKIVRFTSSHGRPLYGALLETSSEATGRVSNLPAMRLGSVLLLTLLGLALWWQLHHSGWAEVEAAAIGLGVVLLPAAQVAAGWAICWPHVLALLLAVAGFGAIEAELERGGLKRIAAILGGCLIYALAALIYQSNALFAIVPIAAVLMVRAGHEPKTNVRWAAFHLSTLVAGLATSFFIVKFLFSHGIFQESVRMQLEANPVSKLGWFFWYPLPNALALYALRDDFNHGALIFWCAVLGVAAVIALGVRFEAAGKKLFAKRKWMLCLLGLPFLAHLVSLAAAERATGYRTLFALSGLVLVLLVYAVRSLLATGRINQLVYYAGLSVLILVAAITAHRNAWSLLAEPQGREWDLVRNAVLRMNFTKNPKVYLITPTREDRSTQRIFSDEFGSLSSDSDWVPKEMFKAALSERFQGNLPAGRSYTLTLGRAVPREQDYDAVIDLRKLKDQRAP